MKRQKQFLLAIASFLVLSMGCSDNDKPFAPDGHNPDLVEKSLASLVAVDGCDELLTHLKHKAIEQMEVYLEQNLNYALDILEMVEWGEGCYVYAEDGGIAMGASSPAGGMTSPPPSQSAKQYSTTNVQVQGVDEADFVKNDGAYIYILADGKFQILDAWPAPQAHKISSVEVEGEPKKLYVFENTAVVFSSLDYLNAGNNQYFYEHAYYSSEQECTYGYNCSFTGDGRALKITVFDIANKADPTVIREMVFTGSYVNSRRINNIVYTMISFPPVTFSGLSYWPDELTGLWDYCWLLDQAVVSYSESDVIAMFEELKAKNKQLILNASITDLLPSITDTRYVNGYPVTEEGLLESCKNFYMSQTDDGQAFLSAVAFEMDKLEELKATTIIGKPGAVYASKDAIYVAVRHYSSELSEWFYTTDTVSEATTVHKFRIFSNSLGTQYVGSGVVKGRVLNQFAMDEKDGYLRIATTTGRVPSPDVHSTVTVLAEQTGELKIVGQIDNIAPTEDIRSVRFNGDVGFVVTFKKTDPLFVLDLSDPTNPTIKGELKIPGFSTYMHLMDDSHVLSIGYDADDQGSFAWFQGIMLQIFDVSDLETPKLIHKEIIGTRGSTSDAATNHLAFNYFPQRNLLAIPMVICEGGAAGNYGNIMTFSGLLVYRVTLKTGFELLGGVPHEEPESQDNNWGACSNWWTESNSKVKRSIFMDDYVFSIALDLINVSSLTDLEHPVASIPLVEQ